MQTRRIFLTKVTCELSLHISPSFSRSLSVRMRKPTKSPDNVARPSNSSLSSTITNYEHENGRRYHGYKKGSMAMYILVRTQAKR